MNWESLLSSKRVSEFGSCPVVDAEPNIEDNRSEFEKDYDQIIFSYPFRRLQDKTQVIPFPEFDFVHTRLTHSLEVASVGRTLGDMVAELIFSELGEEKLKGLGLKNSDIGTLVASSCLAHDIGNPPFGHSGEDAISFYFKSDRNKFDLPLEIFNSEKEVEILLENWKRRQDLIQFEGNANGFRIITQDCQKGVNPTCALLGTFTKYPRESFLESYPETDKDKTPKELSKYGFFQTEREVFKNVASELSLLPHESVESENDIAFHRHPLAYLMEAADDIAYSIIDFEDGLRLGLIDFDKTYKKIKILKDNVYEESEINDSPCGLLTKVVQIDKLYNSNQIQDCIDFKEALGYMRPFIFKILAFEVVEVFKKNYEAIMSGQFDGALINSIENKEILDSLNKMKKLVKKFIYNHRPVLLSEASGFKIMSELIESLAISSSICVQCGEQETEKAKKLTSLLPERYRPTENKGITSITDEEKYKRIRKVLDYVSGMTDNYATSLYRQMNGF
ncbi:dGTP triphosphohydrolase [Jiulongibacter sediminis]|uniref:dGTP triphosphohydrolase n=1 Tax=Jiulongibacter sediminis TaxID=1605367 RepID=UPI0026EF60A4|nr:dNTP triphosphohydrolase [Jiulongibacter sediminis]